jgi:hypothetical protein
MANEYKPPVPTVLSTFGQPGTGKTSYLIYRLHEEHVQRAIILDPFDDIPADVVFHGDLQGCHDYLDAMKVDIANGKNPSFKIRFKPNPDQHWDAANHLAQAAMATRSKFLIDEAHKVAKQHEEAPYLLEIARMGRHYDCALWLASQRPATISRDLTTGGERAFFYTDEPRDLVYVKDTLGKKAAEIIRDLPPFVFIYKHAKIINISEIKPRKGKGNPYEVVKHQDLTIQDLQ